MNGNYILFWGEYYYAAGGANDNIAFYSSAQEAMWAVDAITISDPYKIDWWHIYSIKDQKFVAASEEQAYC